MKDYKDDTISGYSGLTNERTLGDSLPYSKFPHGKTYSYLGVAYESMCALTTTGEVYCVGYCAWFSKERSTKARVY